MACLAGTTWQSDLRHIAYLYAPVQLPFLMLIILVHTLEYGIKKCPDCIAWVWDIFRIFCYLLGYVLTCRWIHFLPGGLRLSRLLCLRASLLTPVCSLHQCRAHILSYSQAPSFSSLSLALGSATVFAKKKIHLRYHFNLIILGTFPGVLCEHIHEEISECITCRRFFGRPPTVFSN